MVKTPPDVDAHAAQLARMRRLCSELDDVREESERLYIDITAEARRLSDAASTRERSGGAPARTPELAADGRDARVPRQRTN